MKKKENTYLLLILTIFSAACIETDIYLPAFSDMMAAFSVTESDIQKLLTWNFMGLCFAGLLYGPVSDAYGRKKPLLAALLLFFAGSVITLGSENYSLMLIGRVLQGVGSGGCFTLGTAIIFDLFQKERAVAALNKLNTIVPFLLAGAPLLGGCLNARFGYRANFMAIAAAVLFSLMACSLFLEETLQPERIKKLEIKAILRDFKRIATSLPFWLLTAVISLLFSGFLLFLSTISVFFVVALGVEKTLFPLYQGVQLLAYLAASLTCGRAIARWGARSVKMGGLVAVFTAGIGIIAGALWFPGNPGLISAAMLPYSFGFMWLQTPYVAEIMALHPDITGAAASVLTSARLMIAAAVIGFAAACYNGTILPCALIIAAALVVIGLAAYTYERRNT